MEIINYIQQPRGKNTSSFFVNTIGTISLPKNGDRKRKSIGEGFFGNDKKVRNRKVRKEVEFSVNMPSDRHHFTAGAVRVPVSSKVILAAIGNGFSKACEFTANNILKILICLAAASGLFTGLLMISRSYEYEKNHTGPLAMQISDNSTDMENLNRFMSEFAMEEPEVNEDGSLSDVDVVINLSEPVTYQNYTVKSGDTISGITYKFGLTNISTLISINDIGNCRQVYSGQKLKIPSIDGVIYTVKSGDTISSIVSDYKISMDSLVDVNELNSEMLTVGQKLFIPGVALDRKTLQKAMGELFTMPIKDSFRWTSPYGWRADPFTGARTFHSGTDMACPTGTPIYATMSGKITYTGVSPVFGNYVIIDHGNGYQTWYAHMSKIIAKKGNWVSQGEKIGLVGSTGYSTGPHLHFMVYKNGNRIDPMSVLKK